ncbi:hypothetical protein BLOT_002840 [Blomia tropicalis]|nr:hypothetical protein BLOT_002840 [Blomia tropicalis]
MYATLVNHRFVYFYYIGSGESNRIDSVPETLLDFLGACVDHTLILFFLVDLIFDQKMRMGQATTIPISPSCCPLQRASSLFLVLNWIETHFNLSTHC